MKWFKHMADARDDDFIEWLEENYGFEGTGRWWRILEIIAGSMDKNSNDPSATHSWKKWQILLRGKRSQLTGYLLAMRLRGKIEVVETGNEMKITCKNILKMRDNHSRNLQVTTKPLTSNLALEAEAEKERKKESTSGRELDSAAPVQNEKPALAIPVPKIKQEKRIINNDLAAAAAACCSLLYRKRLSPLDLTILGTWCEKWDFESQIFPVLIDKTKKFSEKNAGKPPATISYFSPAIQESLGGR